MGYPCTSAVLLGSQQDQLSTRAASSGNHSGGHRRLERLCVQRLSGWAGAVPLPLYDDRGLDVLGGSQKLLLPLYHQFHDWILEYDLEKIDQMFAPAKE